MRSYDFSKRKPKENKMILIVYEDYGWGDSCKLKTACAQMINNECVESPIAFNIKMPLDRIVRWCYI